MKRVTQSFLFLLLSVALCPATAQAWPTHWLRRIRVPDCVGKRCCDDYHAKPLPAFCPCGGFLCDDYCRKPEPCPTGVKCFQCDDYCRKPLPPLTCPPVVHGKCPPPPCLPGHCLTPHCPPPHCPPTGREVDGESESAVVPDLPRSRKR